jgi:hypothetical protein
LYQAEKIALVAARADSNPVPTHKYVEVLFWMK